MDTETPLIKKGFSMKQICSKEPISAPQPDQFQISKLIVTLGNTYVRLSARERQKVMRALTQFAFGKKTSVNCRDLWSESEMKRCYLQLKPISPKMANDMRRWASKLLKVGHNNCGALKCLMDELHCRRSVEEP